MSLASDWQKAAEKFNESVSLQYEQFQKNTAQDYSNLSQQIVNTLGGNIVQDVEAAYNQLVARFKKNLGTKKPIRYMVFELDIFNPPPPIVLFINPETFDIKFQPKVSENRVRHVDPDESGYILQYHHDELDMISASGRSAMFYTNKGLTAYDRINSPGYNNIQQLIAIYRNNGKNLSRKPGKYSLIESVGRVLLIYNEIIYKGSFDSFTVTEADDKPFNLEFSFDYKVTKQIDASGMSSDILRNVNRSQQTIGLVDVL
jgi:hypothetical protein